MWSLGVMLVELYIGRPLFRASCRLLMVKRILSILGTPHFIPHRPFVDIDLLVSDPPPLFPSP